MWRLCLRVMLIGFISVCALPDNPSVMSKLLNKRQTEQRYCGSRLVNILKFLCRSKYHGMDERRKRDTDIVGRTHPQDLGPLPWIQQQEEEEEEEALNTKFPFRSRPVANNFKNRPFRRQERSQGGIVDECCIYKGCTATELRQYCSER